MNLCRSPYAFHPIGCTCPQCDERLRLREQRLSNAPPLGSLPANEVSADEIGVQYKILEDWSDD